MPFIVMNNSEQKCKGKITRRRITKHSREESIIDFGIVCEIMEDMISEVVIDEDRHNILTRHTNTKTGVKIKESDHNSIITQVKVNWNKTKNVTRVEMYNFKDSEGMKKFKHMTSNNNFLSEVFDDKNKDVSVKTKQFLKRFGFCLSKSFTKIRVKQTRHNKALEDLFNRRRILRTKTDEDSIHALEDVDRKLSEMCAEENARTIIYACGGLTCDTGGINVGKLWQLKKNLKAY